MLTDLEAPRTQSEYEDSYIFKVFVFDFINVYSSLIYIAIFKVCVLVNLLAIQFRPIIDSNLLY